MDRERWRERERGGREREGGRERCIFVKVGNFDTKFCTFLSFDQNEIVLPPYTILLTFPPREIAQEWTAATANIYRKGGDI